MYTLIAKNEQGEQLALTDNQNYSVLSVSGTNPPAAAINTSVVAGMDGTRFNSSRVGQRNLVITLALHPPIEQNRIRLYRIFRTKRYISIRYKNDTRDVYTEGYVESVEVNPWTQSQQVQISIICPDAFWESSSETYVSFLEVNALFSFPFSVPAEGIEFSTQFAVQTAAINAGEIETGGVIRFRALDDGIVNPTFYNLTTQQYFGVTVQMQKFDVITINTQTGYKSVKLHRGGTESNLLAARTSGSSWIQFTPGINQISFDAYAGAAYLDVRLTLTQRFEGV